MRTSYNYEVIFFLFQIVLRNSLDPDPDCDFWLDQDPDSIEYGSETLSRNINADILWWDPVPQLYC